MPLKEIPWFLPQLGREEQEEVLKVLESNYINDGEVTRALERKISEYLGGGFCLAVTSGTVAITLSLIALGVGPGDEVIVPDFTFIATANAARLIGAEVKLVDIEPERFTIDSKKVEASITKKTKAVIAVDVNGRAADYEALEALCSHYELALVCDSAEALGSRYKGRYLGTYGDVGCFSLSANKTLTSGQGGLIITSNEKLYFRLKELKDQGRRYGGTGGDDLHPVVGFNFKYTNLQAAVALAQFDRLSFRLDHFKKRDSLYRKLLGNCPTLTFPAFNDSSGEVLQWTDVLCKDREALAFTLKSHKIGFRSFWIPLHKQTPYLLPDEGFDTAIRVSEEGLWLPSSFELTEEEMRFIAEVISNEASCKSLINN